MADLSALGNLQQVEPLDLNVYADQKPASGFRLPPAGVYTLQAPSSFTFGRTQKGALSVQVDPTIVGPTNEGYTPRFIKVSAATYDRDGKRVSQLGDYLRACGVRGVFSDEQALAEAAEATAGRVYQAKLDWQIYKKDKGIDIKGMSKFPKLADGTHQSWIDDPSEKDENGKPIRIFANVQVVAYLAQPTA